MGKKHNRKSPERTFRKAVLIGLLLMLLPLIYYHPNYDRLSTKDIRVLSVGAGPAGRYFQRNYYLTTMDGEVMQLHGDFSYKELEQTLTPNTEVSVKYYRGMYVLWRTDYVVELSHNGTTLVAYSGDTQMKNQLAGTCAGLLVIGTGFLNYNYQTDFLGKIRKKRKNRK